VAAQVIVTSYLFPDAKFSLERLQALSALVGPARLVVDLRCGLLSPPVGVRVRAYVGRCVAAGAWVTGGASL
jgi:hypothetical protein